MIMEELEMTCLQIITNAGEARSECMAAMVEARNEAFEEAKAHLDRAAELMKEAHHVHTELITMDAAGKLMGTEITYALAGEMVELYRKLAK